jgi:hypothetical protein
MRAPERPGVHRVRNGAEAVAISQHAHARGRQRGVKARDIDLIVRFGTATPDGAVLLRSDVAAIRSELASLLRRLDRLVGAFVVVRDGTAITVVRATRVQRRKQTRLVA